MKVYVAPPKGALEKIAFKKWLEFNKLEPVWLDLRFKTIKGPLILCGGADIGKRPQRDTNEFNWIKMALDAKQPIIGVCRGMQVLNLYFGGKVEDLSEAVIDYHKSADFSDDADHSDRKSQFHYVKNIDDQMFEVNSRHHQWCSSVADNFKVICMSFDGGYIPEAFEDDSLKIIAVQWHPERQECPVGVNLFKYI